MHCEIGAVIFTANLPKIKHQNGNRGHSQTMDTGRNRFQVMLELILRKSPYHLDCLHDLNVCTQ
jgi:hypothetical protein